MEESSCRTPLIFVLSPGVDPTGALLQLAETSGMKDNFHALSLGQGQAPIARRMIEEGVNNGRASFIEGVLRALYIWFQRLTAASLCSGHWVFLANCHLSLSWMPELDKLVEQLQVEQPHPNFRLWLSSSPHPDFPITILQSGIKLTTEPPKVALAPTHRCRASCSDRPTAVNVVVPQGVKANMKRLYQLVKDDNFECCSRPGFYKKLLFSLCFFHSILLERKKFLQLGWNIVYGFNDSDFEVATPERLLIAD